MEAGSMLRIVNSLMGAPSGREVPAPSVEAPEGDTADDDRTGQRNHADAVVRREGRGDCFQLAELAVFGDASGGTRQVGAAHFEGSDAVDPDAHDRERD